MHAHRFEYSFGPVHFIHYSTEQAFGPGSAQHNWVKAALARVDRTRTPWLVFSGHRPMYIDSTDTGPPGGDQFVAEKLRVRCGSRYARAACCDPSFSNNAPRDPSYSSAARCAHRGPAAGASAAA